MIDRIVIPIMLAASLTPSCTSAAGAHGSRAEMPIASPSQDAQLNSGAATMRKLLERFPGAVLLDEAEFAQAIEGRGFRYHVVGGDLIIERPGEFFRDGRYSTGHRPIYEGTYSFDREVVLIDCPRSFLGLSKKRVFFRHQGKLFTTSANGTGIVIELTPAS